MDIEISTGQWVLHILHEINRASDGDTFVLPSSAHAHAFEIAKKSANSLKRFNIKVQR
tara:strand:+ start:362 stop:535 length:174 start_codon:yes stop_codon:yes gene_type:complete